MKVIREKSILEKIDAEIDDIKKPPIVRIDLDEGEFEDFLNILSHSKIAISCHNKLIGLKAGVYQSVSKSNVRIKYEKWLGSYVVYRDVTVQCCYEEE